MLNIDKFCYFIYAETKSGSEEVAAMNVSVGKDFEEFVKSKVASGDYASVSEVVRDGLRLLKERDLLLEARLQALRGEIQKGVDQAMAGELLDGPQVMEDLRQELLKKRS
jgi:antitoxin ParD1/3/4